MTPILHPVTPSENRFNESLCRTRVLIEQTFGILKRRFQCLHAELRTSPPNVVTYVIACVVLHNIGIERDDIIDLDADDMTPPNDVPFVNVHVPGQNDGTVMRDHNCHTFFFKYKQVEKYTVVMIIFMYSEIVYFFMLISVASFYFNFTLFL